MISTVHKLKLCKRGKEENLGNMMQLGPAQEPTHRDPHRTSQAEYEGPSTNIKWGGKKNCIQSRKVSSTQQGSAGLVLHTKKWSMMRYS
jgi:hypothetical protein